MNEEHTNAIEIAVIKEQINGLREQHKAHAEATKEQFITIGEKLDVLLAAMNRGRGALTAIVLLAGAVGAFMAKMATVLAGYFHK